MKQDILISKDRWQTQIAVLEDGALAEYFNEPRHLDGLVGNLYVGIVSRILPGMQSAFVNIGLDRDGFLFEGDMGPAAALDEEPVEMEEAKSLSVKDLSEGERILIQCIKEPIGAKGCRLSTQIALPGHYLIHMPHGNHVAVSRKISGQERNRLREIVRRAKGEAGGGFIVRTAAEGTSEEELRAEMQALAELWTLVRMRSQRCEAPALVHQEADLVARAVREIFVKREGNLVVDDPEVARRCQETIASLGYQASKVRLWEDDRVSLFEHYHVHQELEKALRPRVWLPSGGCIVIQSTEALVAIDVNSGRYTGKKSLEETAFTINMEAVDEIVRQIRLRSLGGIIVIDFIDMSKKGHREALLAKLGEALKRDRAKSRILAISEFGLVEMTRKRSHRNLERVMTGACPVCEGRGRVPAPWRTARLILDALDGLRKDRPAVVTASRDVVRYMEENRELYGLREGVRFEILPIGNPAHFTVKPG